MHIRVICILSPDHKTIPILLSILTAYLIFNTCFKFAVVHQNYAGKLTCYVYCIFLLIAYFSPSNWVCTVVTYDPIIIADSVWIRGMLCIYNTTGTVN